MGMYLLLFGIITFIAYVLWKNNEDNKFGEICLRIFWIAGALLILVILSLFYSFFFEGPQRAYEVDYNWGR